MDLRTISEEERAGLWLYLHASPFGVDLGTPGAVRTETLVDLPENLRRLMLNERTAARVYLIGRSVECTDEQIVGIARILRRVLLGESSAAEIERTVGDLGLPMEKAARVAAELTQSFISKNYFQINQVYEKRQKAAGTPPRQGSAGQGRQEAVGTTPPAAPPPSSPVRPATPPTPLDTARGKPLDDARGKPPRVVDLRNGAIPSRLPATPPPLTSGGVPAPRRTTEAPPTPPVPPAAPPFPPPKEAPSPDALLKTLEKRAAPPSPPSLPPLPPTRPSETGGHGPLPPPASV